MKKKPFASLVFAIAVGVSPFFLPTPGSADPLDLVPVCFRGVTLVVPSYLLNRYLAVPGTFVGPCFGLPAIAG